jgi:hypothetical protein
VRASLEPTVLSPPCFLFVIIFSFYNGHRRPPLAKTSCGQIRCSGDNSGFCRSLRFVRQSSSFFSDFRLPGILMFSTSYKGNNGSHVFNWVCPLSPTRGYGQPFSPFTGSSENGRCAGFILGSTSFQIKQVLMCATPVTS